MGYNEINNSTAPIYLICSAISLAITTRTSHLATLIICSQKNRIVILNKIVKPCLNSIISSSDDHSFFIGNLSETILELQRYMLIIKNGYALLFRSNSSPGINLRKMIIHSEINNRTFLLGNSYRYLNYNYVSDKYKKCNYGNHCFKIGPSKGFLLSESASQS